MASLTTEEKLLDRIFSEYIRLKDAKDGIVRCYTCGAFKHWKEVDAGHYISRTHKATRWDKRNVHVQCKKCNSTMDWGRKGNLDEYALRLLKDYGQEVLETLNRAKWIPTKIDAFQVLAMIKHYKEEVKILKDKE